MAPNMDFLGFGLARYLTNKLGVPATFVDSTSWQEREECFHSGEIQLLWICGLPYVNKAIDSDISLVAVPIRSAQRYQGKAVYFSDLVVSARSSLHSFDDMRGKVWSYNEPYSHSGCTAMRYYLSRRGLNTNYFDRVLMAGTHQNSLQMILDGTIDGSAIDSTVLDEEISRRPELRSEIRILDTIGPSPAPPWLLNNTLPAELQARIRQAFWNMHADPQGRRLLDGAKIARFTPVTDDHYDALRVMTKEAASITFPTTRS